MTAINCPSYAINTVLHIYNLFQIRPISTKKVFYGISCFFKVSSAYRAQNNYDNSVIINSVLHLQTVRGTRVVLNKAQDK